MSRGRTAAALLLAAGWLLCGAAGCGRKAKPEPLWSRAPRPAPAREAGPVRILPRVPPPAVPGGGGGSTSAS